MRFLGTALALALLCAAGGHRVQADVTLPSIFSDHMVLQRDAATPIWGRADAGEKITVTLAGQSHVTQANAQGKWMIQLAPLAAAGPHALTVRGKNVLTVQDVLVGEVWLGSGQSNMAMAVSRANDFEKEKSASDWPQIRMFTVRSGAAATAQDDCAGSWVVCSPETVGGFSATLGQACRPRRSEPTTGSGLVGNPQGSRIAPAVSGPDPGADGGLGAV